MTDTPTPRLVLAYGSSHYTTDTGELPRQSIETLCGRRVVDEDPRPRVGEATCTSCARLLPTLANPYMSYTRDELGEAVEQIAQAIAAGQRLREEDRLHLITESELELAETRKRIVVNLFRTGSGRAGWGAGYWSWERIGNALGISRQAARKTYGPLAGRAAIADQVARESESSS